MKSSIFTARVTTGGSSPELPIIDRQIYRHHGSDPAIGRNYALCPLCQLFTRSRNHTKVVPRHMWTDSVERKDAHRLTPAGKLYNTWRREAVERSFAEAKQLHWCRYARLHGLSLLQPNCLLAAACQNMKTIALLFAGLLGPFML